MTFTRSQGFLALALSILSAVPAAAQDWTSVPLGTTETVLVVENTSFGEKYVAGTNGYVAQSSAVRTIWTPVSVGTSADLVSILQPSSGAVWLGGEGGAVRVKSGANWLVKDVPSGGQDIHLFTRNGGLAIAVGSGGGIWKTTNGGADWTAQASGTTSSLNAGAGFVTALALVVGDGGTILRTTNGGTEWAPVSSGTTADLESVVEAGASKVAAGDLGTILRSTDGGVTWTAIPSGTSARLRALSVSKGSANWIIAVGDNGSILKSVNNGVTWCLQDPGAGGASLHGVEAAGSSEYIVAGPAGTLLRTTNGGGFCVSGTGVDVAAGPAPAFRVVGPWPNPVRGAASFSVDVDRDLDVKSSILDAAGRRIGEGPRDRLAAGARRSMTFGADGFASGVYFLRVEAGGASRVSRFVVVR